MRVEWDETKNRANRRRHGLSFQEASELFDGSQDFLEIFDATHSWYEDRFKAIGPIARGVILVVYVEADEDVHRIISAREATRREKEMFHDYQRWRRA